MTISKKEKQILGFVKRNKIVKIDDILNEFSKNEIDEYQVKNSVNKLVGFGKLRKQYVSSKLYYIPTVKVTTNNTYQKDLF